MGAAVGFEPDALLELRNLSPRPARATGVHLRIDARPVAERIHAMST